MFDDLVYKPYLNYNHVMEMLDSQPHKRDPSVFSEPTVLKMSSS